MDEIPDYDDLSDEQKIDIRQFNGALDIGADLTGWNLLYLKEQIKKAIRQIGFEYPSEVQKAAIPVIMQGRDILCQARSGMGKTAVFIIGVLNQLTLVNGTYKPFNCLVICHTRELAHQIFKDFRRLGKYFKNPDLRIGCFFGGFPTDIDRNRLSNKQALPHIVIGTPGRLKILCKQNLIPLSQVTISQQQLQYLIIDQCDQVLSNISMLKILRQLHKKMPHKKQVMMFSATINETTIKTSKQLLNDQQHIFIDTGKLTLTGLYQFNIPILQKNKLQKLIQLLDTINYNQGVIFLNKVQRTKKLTNILAQKLFNPICIHSNMTQQDRIKNFDNFKLNKAKLLIATDLFGRGIDVERVNLVVNYDLPYSLESYLHRIGRAGRFNTKGIAINFVCQIGDQSQEQVSRKDVYAMKEIQDGLQTPIPELPSDFDYRKYI